MSSPILHGRVVRAVSSSYVIRNFGSNPREFGFVVTNVSRNSFVSQVIKVTRCSIYLRAFFSAGHYVDTRIDIRKHPIIYVLDPTPLVFFNDKN